MAIDPNSINTIRVGQLADAPFSLTDQIPHEVGSDLKRGSVQSLADFIAIQIGASAGISFVAVTVPDGGTLPDTTKEEWLLVGKGTFYNVNGGATIVTTEELNALVSNGTFWSIGVEIPIAVDLIGISQTILSGNTQTAPSENAVFNALAEKANVDDIPNPSIFEVIANKQDDMSVDDSGIKYPTVDAVNDLTNTIARATMAVGFIDTTDSFVLSVVNSTTLGIGASQFGIVFPEHFKTTPYAPETGIKFLTARNIPLPIFAGTGTAVKYVGWRESDDTILFSNDPYIQNIDICQLGLVFIKWSAGVTSFLDATRDVLTVPDISAYSNLETVGIGIKSDVIVGHTGSGMTIKNTAGSVKGISVNWHGANNDFRNVTSANPSNFQRLSPGNNLTSTPPAIVNTVVVNDYWNGTALVAVPSANNATVQAILLTIRGTIVIQVAEQFFADFQSAKDNAATVVFSNVLPIGTYVEIGRLVSKKSTTNLANNTDAVFITVSGGSGGGGGGSSVDILTQTVTDGDIDHAPSGDAVFEAIKTVKDSIGALIKEQFVWTSGTQTFTLLNNYYAIDSVVVQGVELKSTQYTLVSPNKVTINDALNANDYIIIHYSTASVGVIFPDIKQISTDVVNNANDIKSLKASSFTELETITLPAINNVGYLNSIGVYTPVPGNIYRTSDFIPIDSSKELRLKYATSDNVTPICYYSSNTEVSFISSQGKSVGNDINDVVNLDYPTNAAFYRLSKTTSRRFDMYSISYIANEASKLSTIGADNSNKEILFKQIDLTKNTTAGYISLITGAMNLNAQWLSSDFILYNPKDNYVVTSSVNNVNIPYAYFYTDTFVYLGSQGTTNLLNGRTVLDGPSFPTAKYTRYSWSPNASGYTFLYKFSYGYEKDKVYEDALIIPIYGQSNAAGYSANPSLTDFCKYDKNLFNLNTFPLIENFTIEEGSTTMPYTESSLSGTGEKIFSDILQMYNDTRTSVYPIKIAQGGASITSFIKGSANYTKLLSYVKRLSDIYLVLNRTVRVPAFCYIQGEAELENSVDYKGLLTQIQIDLNTDIKAITGQTQDVYCCLYNLSYVNSIVPATKNLFSFNQLRVAKAQYELIRDNPKFITSSPTYGLTYNLSDAIHLSNVGQRQMGVYQGDSISKLLKGIIKKGNYVVSTSVSGNVITLNINTPKLPLVIDTTYIPARTNYGFSVISTSDIDLISSVAVNTAVGTITINCSSSPVGSKLRYGNGGTVNVYGGNIRDSEGMYLSQVILGKVYEFHNWLQIFEIQL